MSTSQTCDNARCSDYCYLSDSTPLCACPVGEMLLYGRTTTCGTPNQLCGQKACSDICYSIGAEIAQCGCSDQGESLQDDGLTCGPNPKLEYISLCDAKNCDGGCYVESGVAFCTCPEGEILADESQNGITCIPDPCLTAGCDGGCVYKKFFDKFFPIKVHFHRKF